LWPLPADWKRTTGFSPNTAAANAARSGRTRPARPATTNSVARLAPTATDRNALISPGTLSTMAVTPAERAVNAGPYTAGVDLHFGPTKGARGSSGKSAGVAT